MRSASGNDSPVSRTRCTSRTVGTVPARSVENGPSSRELVTSTIRPSRCAETLCPLPMCTTTSLRSA